MNTATPLGLANVGLSAPGARLIPGAAAIAARTAARRETDGRTICNGELAPAGKWRSSSVCPCWDSTTPVNALLPLRLVSRLVRPMQRTASTAIVAPAITRWRRPTRSAMRRHGPWVASAPLEPSRGMNGQNARRPAINSSEGSSVRLASIASATPIAEIGPRPRVLLTSAASTQSRARITVIALAKITGPARRSATRIASRRSAWWRNSSR